MLLLKSCEKLLTQKFCDNIVLSLSQITELNLFISIENLYRFYSDHIWICCWHQKTELSLYQHWTLLSFLKWSSANCCWLQVNRQSWVSSAALNTYTPIIMINMNCLLCGMKHILSLHEHWTVIPLLQWSNMKLLLTPKCRAHFFHQHQTLVLVFQWSVVNEDVIALYNSGWLGSKHQLTNERIYNTRSVCDCWAVY